MIISTLQEIPSLIQGFDYISDRRMSSKAQPALPFGVGEITGMIQEMSKRADELAAIGQLPFVMGHCYLAQTHY